MEHTYIEEQKTQTQEPQIFNLINPYNDIEPSVNSISAANTYNYNVSSVNPTIRVQSTEPKVDHNYNKVSLPVNPGTRIYSTETGINPNYKAPTPINNLNPRSNNISGIQS